MKEQEFKPQTRGKAYASRLRFCLFALEEEYLEKGNLNRFEINIYTDANETEYRAYHSRQAIICPPTGGYTLKVSDKILKSAYLILKEQGYKLFFGNDLTEQEREENNHFFSAFLKAINISLYVNKG